MVIMGSLNLINLREVRKLTNNETHMNKENKTPDDGQIKLLGGNERTIQAGRWHGNMP